jgi:PAS domain S-box-containing protein
MAWEPTALLEALDDTVGVFTRDGVVVWANRAALRLSGASLETLVGVRVWSIFPGSTETEFYRAFQRVQTSGQHEHVDSYYPPWERWFHLELYLIEDHVYLIARDITALRQGEARTRAHARISQALGRVLDLGQLYDALAHALADLIGDGCAVHSVDGALLAPLGPHENGQDGTSAHSRIEAALTDGDERIAVVTMTRDRTPYPYSAADLSLLRDLADRASMAVTRARIHQQAQLERSRALAVARASRVFTAAERDTRSILDRLARAAGEDIGEIAVANVLNLDATMLLPVAFHSSSEIAQEVQALLSAETPVAGSMSEAIIKSGKPMCVNHIDLDAFAASAGSKYAATVRRFQPRSFVMVPIKHGERVIGTLAASRTVSTVPYTDDDVRLLEELADRAALAIENATVLDAERIARRAAERAAEQTRRLQAIGAQLTHRRSPSDIAETILRESAAVLGPVTGGIWLLDPTGMRLDMLASVGYAEPAKWATLPIASGSPLAHSVTTKTAAFLANAEEYAARFPTSAARVTGEAPRDFGTACVPLISEGRAIGGLAFAYPHAHAFTPDERSFIEVLASQCAQAVDRARLLEQEHAASVKLAEINRTLNTVIHASPAAIIIADLSGTCRLWNPAAERMFGWAHGEMIGKRWPEFERAFVPDLRDGLSRVGRGEEIRGLETRHLRRDGSAIDVAVWAAPVLRPDGEVQALGLFVDITDRKRAEELARTADRRKDEFLAMLGHELRNPLAPILTALELMRMRGEAGGHEERATIERQTRHLVRLVDDLLDISRITRGKLELRKTRTDVATVIGTAVEMASPLLEQRSHHLSIAAPRGLLFVEGDEFRLAQVFQNLLTNAAKYTPSGGSLTVRLTAVEGHAVVEIEDNGEGIAADILPTIFEPFVQGTRKLERSQGGLGIGLTLVRSLTELHGGRVEAYSAGPGHGSRFTVRLPLSASIAREGHITPAGTNALGAARRRVLVVDDNHDAAEMLASLLRAAGHEVSVAFDGPSAMRLLASFTPDVALLDIGLPTMDGYDLARRLRNALPELCRLIAVTGYGQEHDRRRSHEAGFAAHLVKPVQAAQILAAVDDTSR